MDIDRGRNKGRAASHSLHQPSMPECTLYSTLFYNPEGPSFIEPASLTKMCSRPRSDTDVFGRFVACVQCLVLLCFWTGLAMLMAAPPCTHCTCASVLALVAPMYASPGSFQLVLSSLTGCVRLLGLVPVPALSIHRHVAHTRKKFPSLLANQVER